MYLTGLLGSFQWLGGRHFAKMLLGAGWSSAQSPDERSAARLMDDLMGGPFALIDHTGKPRTDQDFRGKLLLIYFGYSYCPDVCPTDLQQIGLAVDGLGSAGEKLVTKELERLQPRPSR